MQKRQAVHVLLIEDSKSDAALVQRILSDASPHVRYDFTTVPRLVDALYLLDTHLFDVALLDLNLLDVEGIASVSALHAASPGMPIVVYSGTDDVTLRQQAVLCGARHYLVKGKESGYAIKFMIEQVLAA